MSYNFPFRIFRKQISRKNLSDYSDEELVVFYQQKNDPEVVTMLMYRYSDEIAGMSINYLKNEHDAEDFAQELYLKLVNILLELRIKNFKSWLLSTVKNLLIDTGRKAQNRLKYLEKVRQEKAQNKPKLSDYNVIEVDQVLQSFHILNDNEKKCLNDLYLKEKTYKEAMDANNWTFNQLRGYRDRAINKLRDHLKSIKRRATQKIPHE